MNLVLSIAIGDEYRQIAAATHPSLCAYAARIGADVRTVTETTIAQTTPHWEKFQIADLLDTYDRILYLDTDLIIREDCPDLFAEVPEAEIGLFNEAPFTGRSSDLLIDVCKQYDVILPTWDGRYFNTGVMVISRAHRQLFVKPVLEVCNFWEQTYLNMIIARSGVRVHDLHYRFNRMTCMDACTGEDRAAAFVIHYAGALYHLSVAQLVDLIRQDLDRWTRDAGQHEYHRHIYVSVNGGLGDQICSEPAIRFMRTQLYPDDELVVATHWPRLFQHLRALGVTVCEHGRTSLRQDTPYYIVSSLPGPDTVQWRIVSHLLCHSVDYTAIALMHRTLPREDRSIHFEVMPPDLAEVDGLKDATVIHPGRHWNSKTFPLDWWQAVVDGLAQTETRVCLVGREEPGDPPDYQHGARGTVPLACPDGVTDLRNRLSLGGLAALLSQARVLVSNDSAPVHLAGAFDAPWIVLIPSCKHPDHILPYRHGTQAYKTLALYKRLVIDDIEARPTQVYSTTADLPEVDWATYLPDPDEVVTQVRRQL